MDCGKWGAVWSSRFCGADLRHNGDLVTWCKECSTLSDVLLSDYAGEVRMSPSGVDWADQKEWFHVSGPTWDVDCADEVYVHLGRREVSEWLWRIRQGTSDEIEGATLYRVRVRGKMPKRLVHDKGEGWGKRRTAYINGYEFVGSVCLYIPKGDLEVLERTEL